MSQMPKNGDHRYLLIDSEISPGDAAQARLNMAAIAAERNDPCGLLQVLLALGLIGEDDEDVPGSSAATDVGDS
jgi:hypothetical protein